MGYVAINAYNIFIGKPEGKRPHERCRHRWEDNIRMDLRSRVEKRRLNPSDSG